jgi:hypothetical protein
VWQSDGWPHCRCCFAFLCCLLCWPGPTDTPGSSELSRALDCLYPFATVSPKLALDPVLLLWRGLKLLLLLLLGPWSLQPPRQLDEDAGTALFEATLDVESVSCAFCCRVHSQDVCIATDPTNGPKLNTRWAKKNTSYKDLSSF